jgi:hypothetical protein
MSKEIHNELYVIEDYVDVEHANKLSKSFVDVRFWIGDNSIHGTKDDVEEHTTQIIVDWVRMDAACHLYPLKKIMIK